MHPFKERGGTRPFIIRKNPPGLSLVVEVTVTMPSFALGLLITFKTQSGTLGLVGASMGMNRRMGHGGWFGWLVKNPM